MALILSRCCALSTTEEVPSLNAPKEGDLLKTLPSTGSPSKGLAPQARIASPCYSNTLGARSPIAASKALSRSLISLGLGSGVANW